MKHIARRFSAVSSFAVLSLLGGCMGSRSEPPTCWLVSAEAAGTTQIREAASRMPARIGAFAVRSPYDGVRMAVLRSDGSIAFDPVNTFAARPEMMLKCAAFDILASRGELDFAGQTSGTNVVYDVSVTRLALDCRKEGIRTASVGVTLAAKVVEGRGRPVSTVICSAEGGSDAADGNYSAAFSKAFSTALVRAYEGTKAR